MSAVEAPEPLGPPAHGQQWLALHGLAIQVPASWDLVAQQGQRRDGAWRLAEDQRPALQVSWSSRRGDPHKTMQSVARRIGQATGAVIVHQEACGDGGLLARLASPEDPNSALHVAITALADGGWCIWRQTTPGSRDELVQITRSYRHFAVDEVVPWRCYGIGLDLPGYWRLQGIQHGAGSLRAVWFAYGNPRRSTTVDGILTLRRWVRADYVLGEAGLASWVRQHLPRPERLEFLDEANGRCVARTMRQRAGWLNRWRDRREPVDWLALCNEIDDRLYVIERSGTSGLALSMNDVHKDAGPLAAAAAVYATRVPQ